MAPSSSQAPSFSSFVLPPELQSQSQSQTQTQTQTQYSRRRSTSPDGSSRRRHRQNHHHDRHREGERKEREVRDGDGDGDRRHHRDRRRHDRDAEEREHRERRKRHSHRGEEKGRGYERSSDDDAPRKRHRHQHRHRDEPGCEAVETREKGESSGAPWDDRISHDGRPIALASAHHDRVWDNAVTSAHRQRLQGWQDGVIDTQGDRLAAQYGRIDASKVPRYRTAGCGCVLGLPPWLRIVKRSRTHAPTGIEVAPGGRRSAKRYHETGQAAKLRCTPTRRVRPRVVRSEDPGEEAFVPLKEKDAARRRRCVEDEQVYRSMYAQKEREDSAEEDSEMDSDSSSLRPPSNAKLASAQNTVKELDRRVREDPSDIRAWLALADVQVELARAEQDDQGSTRARPSARSRSSHTGAVQLAVLEKARKAHASNRTSTPLALARLQVAISGGLWDAAKIESEWRKILSPDNTDSAPQPATTEETIAVWNRYLAWRTSDATFSVDRTSEAFAEALHAFRSLPACDAVHKAGLAMQLRLCLLLRKAGYPARAFGILQAQLEYALALPLTLEAKTWDRQMDALRDVWDSEQPRFGEVAALGWARTVLVKGTDTELPADAAAAALPSTTHARTSEITGHTVPPDDADPLEQWCAHQREMSHLRRYPARTHDVAVYSAGEGEVDPFSVVFFSDIEDYLVPGRSTALKHLTVQNMLLYLGLFTSLSSDGDDDNSADSGQPHVAPAIDSQCFSQAFWPESLREGGIEAEPAFTTIDGEPMQKERRSLLSDPFACPLVCGSLIDLDGRATQATLRRILSSEDAGHAAVIVRVLDQALDPDHCPSSRLRILRLALEEALHGRKPAVALAKTYLSSHGEDWPLWRAFARLERRSERFAAARRVYTSSLLSDRLTSHEEAARFWREWAEMEVQAGRPRAAQHVLVEAASHGCWACPAESDLDVRDEEVLDGEAGLAEARAYFDPQRQDAAAAAAAALPPDVAACSIWFHYLAPASSEDGLPAALSCASAYLEDARHGGGATPHRHRHRDHYAYRICVARSRIIWQHLSRPRAVYRPAAVRAALLHNVRLFPRDATFLALLAAHEARFKVEGVLRDTMERIVLPCAGAGAGAGGDQQGTGQLEALANARARAETDAGTPWLMALYAQLHFNRYNVNAHLVRALFERALASSPSSLLSSSSTATPPTLWRLYLSFELRLALEASRPRPHQRPRPRHARVRATFYRAAAACPFDREVYLCAFERPLARGLSSAERADVCGVMAEEREVRVYGGLPLEEGDGEGQEEGQGDGDGSEEGEGQ